MSDGTLSNEDLSNVAGGFGGGGIPSVNPNKCFGCGVCVDSCPYSAISVMDDLAVVNGNCIGYNECGECGIVCPVKAFY